ncbi:hypothetical protein Clacol_006634 [Clathrus columnatus]|uniref:TOG domain-containing protein n=1 Tax=Clathrus columnatus TaxID=1419009 RepID=A0AAV5ACK9_9AGAM|nr:hypothetical protein Clacol_006634 [Clathrus columnatus]
MDGPPPQEEDFSQIPILERLKHKNWKARLSAYEQLLKTFQATGSDTDPAFKPYISNPDLLKNMVMDTNAVAQEKGVECVVVFVKYAGETTAKTREVVIPALVEKCLGSTRAGTRTNSIELILQYTEVENTGAGAVADLLPGLGAKQPKTVSATVLALKELVRVFGTQVIPPQTILKALPKIFGHNDKTVRTEGSTLAQCLYQCIGPAIEPFLNDLKPVQVKELHEAFEVLDKEGKGKGTFKAERFTRQQARDMEQAALAGDDAPSDSGAAVAEVELDPRAFAEEVDVVLKLPPNYAAALNSSKWKERKEALDEILTALNTPKIKDSPELSDLIKALAGRMGDANVNCVIVAANCIEALAKGLMQAFARHRETIVPPLLGRLKERKQSVTDALGLALDAVFVTTTLPDILGDMQPFLADKNPQIKEGTLKFLHRSLQKTTLPPTPPQIKPLSESLAALLGDSVADVRDNAALALGTLMKIVGERPLNPVLEPLEASRKTKVKEAFEQATVRYKAGVSVPKVPAPAAKETTPVPKKKPQPISKKLTEEKEAESVKSDPPVSPVVLLEEDLPTKPRGKPPARLLAKKPAVSASPQATEPPASGPSQAKKPPAAFAANAAKSAKQPPPAVQGPLDTFKYKHTPDDAEALAASSIPETIAAGLGDSNWKTRLAAAEEMNTWLEGTIAEADSEVIVRFIAKKGWSEKNFQVSAKLYGIISMLAMECPSFGRSSVALCVGHLSEKLGDLKLKKPAGDTLLLLAEKTSLSFVLNQVYEPLSKQKAPKVLADSIAWINQALTEFGIAGLSLRNLIEALKTALKNSNATVRSSATTTLVTVKLFAGSSIKDLLEDLNPQLLATIYSEFDKVEGHSPPVPSRVSTDLASLPQGNDASKSKGGDPLDELFPRVDLDKLLHGTTILADSKNDAWKSRKEGLEALQGLLDIGANKRLKPSMGDIGQVLKTRIADTNKAVQLLALSIVGRIATGMNKPFEKHSRLFVAPITAALADQKTNIRTAALQTLTAIANACEGIDSMVGGIGVGLESSNPLQRASLLNWIAEWFKNNQSAADYDLQPWAAPVVSCLEDRNGDVRKGAQAVLPIVMKSIGFDKLMKETGSLKSASRTTVIPMIQAAKPSVVENPAPNVTSTTSATTASPAPVSKNISHPPAELPTTNPDPAETVRQSPSPQSVPSQAYGNGRLTGVRSKKIQPSISRPDSQLSTRDEELGASSRLTKPGIGLKRPASAATSRSVPTTASPTASLHFNGSSLEAKKSRLSKDSSKWIFDSNTLRKDLYESLQHQMEGHLSRDLISRLFSTSHNALTDIISGLDIIVDYYASAVAGDDKFGISIPDMQAVLIANSDFPLKYISMKIHEPQPNLVSKCLDVVDNVLSLLRSANHQLTDAEALCFVPTLIHKLGDAREAMRIRVSQTIQTLPKVYAYSRVFQLLLEHGLKSKVAKTRQGSLEELEDILRRAGIGACEPAKSIPVIASMIADKDPYVRKAALSTLSEAYILVGEKIWTLVGVLPPKDKTQLEERLRRVSLPETKDDIKPSATKPSIVVGSKPLNRPTSPAMIEPPRSMSPSNLPRVAKGSNTRPASPPSLNNTSKGTTTTTTRTKSLLPSRLGPNRARPNIASNIPNTQSTTSMDRRALQPLNGTSSNTQFVDAPVKSVETEDVPTMSINSDVTVTISSILSHDPSRSVDALKKIQKILEVLPEEAHLSASYVELSEHTEGLIETITLQMGHVFETPNAMYEPENFRLAKHLNQTLNAFCDHPLLAEALSVDIVTGLLEELTLRLLQTDDSNDSRIKDLSRFINMIILRLFATCRRIVTFRALFGLLLQIVRPFTSHTTQADSQEAKVAELVLKCVWKLARNIPGDLNKQLLDPVELFPAIEHFLQSVPPNEWRARAANKVPAGDMPLRTIKVIVQHIVAQYGEEVYEKISGAFEDPSATIVYPYVYRILNSSPPVRATEEAPSRMRAMTNASETVVHSETRRHSPPAVSQASTGTQSARSSQYSVESKTINPPQLTERLIPSTDDDDPDTQLIKIISNISSETTGALHKEGITQLHKFLKAYPHKKPRVDKLLDSTGPAFRKYIARALASRAAEDDERDIAVADTLSRLEAVRRDVPRSPISTRSSSPRRLSVVSDAEDPKLTRLHDLFGYHGRPTRSSAGSVNSGPPTNSRSSATVDADNILKNT